ncbi:MAG: hypothetical protein MUF51_00760, partial [Vicinamibacteria bacterium]|nr:hypothetical protein [Vicinamibacteria bacterium]
DPVAAPRRLIGPGPPKLTLARRYEHVWREPAGKAARTPDTWQFDLPAAAEVNIELTGEMQADIVSVAPENKTVSIAKVPPQRGYRGTLPRGRYLLQVSAARQNNRAPYTVAVWPTVLMAGMERSITTPATIPVAVGQAGLVTFASFGMVDTRARLLDSSGLTVAANDDRPNDWNFYIGDVLMPGAYTLTVDSATGDNGSSVVSMRAPSEVLEPALALPDTREIKPGQATRIYPLTMAQDTHLLSFDASSKESIGLALEAERDGQVVVLAAQTGQQVSLAVPIERRPGEQAPRNLRLRLFSLDQRGSPVTLKAHALAPAAVSESELEKGVVLAAAQERGAPAARRVAIARPGLFAVEAAAASLRVCTAYGAPCAPVAGVARATLPTPLAIIGTGGERIRARRVVMTPPSSAAVAITDGRSLTVDVRSRTEGPLVVRAFARTGQPGVVIMKDAGNDPKAPLAMAIGDHAALAVRLKTRAAAARIYAASGPTASFDAEVLANSFAAPVAQSASFGVLDVAVPGEQARAFAIPGAPQRVHLALGADLVAVLSRGDEIESVHWGDDGNTAITTAAQADRLTLLNLNKTAARAAIELLPAKDELTERTIAAGHPVETRHVTAGVERVAVAAPFDAAGVTTLHVRGAELPPTFVGGDGSVRRGTDIRLGAGERGMLLIPHGVGTTLAWLDSAGKEAEGLWAVGQAPAARDVTLPAVVALQGEAQAFRVQAKSPLLLHARTDAPVVTALTRPAQEPSVDIHARGGTFDAYLPAGGSLLTLRALNNAQLSGTLELSATAVTPIDEGGSAEVLLAAGSARIFSFTVERKGAVGLGVRASADVVETILMNASGREIARGTNQMLTLDPGTYLLALRLPADTAPVTASPKVVGLKLPDTGPPPDVVERYVAQEKASAVFTARAAEAEASESEGVATDEESAGDGEEGVSEEDAPPSEETTDETQGGGRP